MLSLLASCACSMCVMSALTSEGGGGLEPDALCLLDALTSFERGVACIGRADAEMGSRNDCSDASLPLWLSEEDDWSSAEEDRDGIPAEPPAAGDCINIADRLSVRSTGLGATDVCAPAALAPLLLLPTLIGATSGWFAPPRLAEGPYTEPEPAISDTEDEVAEDPGEEWRECDELEAAGRALEGEPLDTM